MAISVYRNFEEDWRPVPGYEDFYSVSSWGRVRSESRAVVNQSGFCPAISPRRVMSPTIGSSGYRQVCLKVDGRQRARMVHRLVADAFLPESDIKPEINHIDLDKLNNEVWNLERCTRRQNCSHSSFITRGMYGIDRIGTKYRARISPPHGKRLLIGYFRTKKEAIAAYDKFVIENGWNLRPHRFPLNSDALRPAS